MLRLQVPGMTCGGCAAAVRRALAPVAGIDEIRADPATHVVEVRGAAEEAAVCEALRAAGYPVTAAERVAMNLGAAG